MDQQRQSQGGTATQAGQQAGHEAAPTFSLTPAQTLELQKFRRDTGRTPIADNATVVLLVGNAHWSPQQVQDGLGINAADVNRVCRGWVEQQMSYISNAGPLQYYIGT